MYPSINNNGNIRSFTSINVQPMKISSLYNYNNDANNLSKTPREHSSSSFHLLSPHYNFTLEDETILSDLLQQENPFEFSHDHNNHQNHTNIVLYQQHSTHHDIRPISLQPAMQKCSNNNGKFVAKDGNGDNDGFDIDVELKSSSTTRRPRSSNKDRHSKINTARGSRHRRMRLSIDVAKKFFKLQDMLGFDKASKTVDWLLMNSNSGIQELLPTQKLNMRSNFMVVSNNNSASSTSNCEVLANSSSNCIKEKKKGSIGRSVRKSAYLLHSPLAKETRERARARARERTVEKSSKIQCSKSRPFFDQVSSTIDQPEQQISHHNLQFKQGISGGDDDSSLMTENWSPSMFNYQHAGALLHKHQFDDFQIIGNLWEGNN